jgi:hypothetical protein
MIIRFGTFEVEVVRKVDRGTERNDVNLNVGNFGIRTKDFQIEI